AYTTGTTGTSLAIAATLADKAEGNTATTSFTFTLTRSGDVSGNTTVNYTVAGSGGVPASAADFGSAFPSGLVSFGPSEASKILTVGVSGDTTVEPDETFSVTLSG